MPDNLLRSPVLCPVCGAPANLVVTVRYAAVPAVVGSDNEAHWWVFEGVAGKRIGGIVESLYCSAPGCEWSHPWPEAYLT